ncbi:MAG: glycoside hydrolase family 15 protein [Actinobacteria bacterium]|nr:glycoside hydrolase family 15 protein [Actinomycetota bacterium]
MAEERCPPIADYGLIGDCRSAALVSTAGAIDWCCLPRMDQGSCFGRLLDWKRGGCCTVAPAGPARTRRRYLDGTLVLETRLACEAGEVRLLDCFAVAPGEEAGPRSQLLRIVEGVRGAVTLEVRVAPRFDYGELPPWIRDHGGGTFSATGGDDALLISGDLPLEARKHELCARLELCEGERRRLSIEHVDPVLVDERPRAQEDAAALDARLDATVAWWREWSSRASPEAREAGVLRSTLVLKALANPATGAIAAAPTTSLPEVDGGDLNWDYRFSWVRDSTFTVRSLAEVGYDDEADAFRRFVERSAAGSAEGVQVMFGLGGERRLGEVTLELAGYRGARPVRVGNSAADQCQLGVYGQLLELAWRWHLRDHRPDDDYWRFLVDVADAAAARWREPDRGIWEVRGDPRHFVHSKAMCWAGLDRAIRLAEDTGREAPLERWAAERDAAREAIESDGYDAARRTFVQAFGDGRLDAALLLLPTVGFVEWDDERMVGTADAIREELDADGLLLRYRVEADEEHEGAFLACSFWLAECLAHQGRADEAAAVFERAAGCANDLGLFSEEADPRTGELLGNFPQGLTHLAHISAALALAGANSAITAPLTSVCEAKDAVIRSGRLRSGSTGS